MLTDKELKEIRRKMERLEIEPPVNAWDLIKLEIKPKRRFRGAWWLGSALLLLGFLFFLNFSNQQTKNRTANLSELPVLKKQQSTDSMLSESKTAKDITLKNKNLMSKSIDTLNLQENKTTAPRSVASQLLIYRKNKGANYKSARIVPDSLKQSAINGKDESIEQESSNVTKDTSENTSPNQAEPTTPVDSAITPKQLKSNKIDSSDTKPTLAAEGKNQPKKKEDWLLGLVISPTYAFKIMVPRAGDSLSIMQLKDPRKVNSERIGLELGLQFTKPLNSRLHLELGLSWLKLKENFSYRLSNRMYDTLQESQQLISSFDYGGARIGLAYYFRERPKSKFNVMLTGGANRLLGGKTEQYYNGQLLNSGSTSSSNNVLAKSNYNVSVGWGYTRPLNSDFEIRVMPVFNYYFGSVYAKQEPFRLRPYFLGLHLTFKRNFSRGQKTTNIPSQVP